MTFDRALHFVDGRGKGDLACMYKCTCTLYTVVPHGFIYEIIVAVAENDGVRWFEIAVGWQAVVRTRSKGAGQDSWGPHAIIFNHFISLTQIYRFFSF